MSQTPLSATDPAARGAAIVPNFGSAPGELAACLSQVGIVDRSDLACIQVDGAPAAVTDVVDRMTGGPLAVGGGRKLGEAWWCRPDTSTLLVLCPHAAHRRLTRLLRDEAQRRLPVEVDRDQTDRAFLGVVGRRTVDVLAALGVLGDADDPRHVSPCRTVTLDRVQTVWLLESDVCAVVGLPRVDLETVRRSIERRSRPFGMARVGREAFDNYRIFERRQSARPS